MKRVLAVLSLVGALVIPGPAVAQSPIDVSALTVRCEALDGPDKATCLYVVARFLDPVAATAPSPEYGADLPSVGVTQVGPQTDLTLVKVDWKVKPSPYSEPAEGNRLVSIDVLYLATQDDASYNPYDWSMVDFDGFNYERASGGNEPELSSSSASLPLGRKAQGWVTFEVPKNIQSFEVVASAGGDLLSPTYVRWRIDEKR